MFRRLTTRARSATIARIASTEPALARLQVAWLSVHAGKTCLLVTNLVVAYSAGGVAALGVFGIARFLVPTVLSPFAGLPTTRWPATSVLTAANTVRVLAVVLILASVVTGLPAPIFFLGVALESAASSMSRPLHVAMLPFVARTPAGLVASNVASSAVEGAGTFIGPAIAGVLLATAGPPASLAAVALIYAIGVIALLGARVRVPTLQGGGMSAIRDQSLAGLRTFRDSRGPRLILTGIFLQTLVRGMLNVLIVIAAVGILGLGEGGVGNLNAVLGAGGLVGAGVAMSLAGRQRMAAGFVLSLAAWSAPLALIGLMPLPVIAGVAMLAIGTANAVVDVSAYTLLQRTTPRDRRVGVLGLFDSLANGGQAVGGVLAPVLVATAGIQGALVVAGLVLPVAALLLWPGLRATDPGAMPLDRRLELIRAIPLFGPLSLAAAEDVASELRPVTYAAGDFLIRQGEPGHEYLVIDDGEIEVSQDGRPLHTMGPGSGVGEIALLHDVPRTASVRALGPVQAFSLAGEDFRQAVLTGPALGS